MNSTIPKENYLTSYYLFYYLLINNRIKRASRKSKQIRN